MYLITRIEKNAATLLLLRDPPNYELTVDVAILLLTNFEQNKNNSESALYY